MTYTPSIPSSQLPCGSPGGVAVDSPLRLGHLPLVMDVFRRLGLASTIDEVAAVPAGTKALTSTCVAVIICGVFVGAHSLWRLRERLSPYDMRTIMQDANFQLGIFTDERLGAALDALYVAGLDGIMTQVALGVINRLSISTRYISFDTTSLSFCGGFEREDPFADREGVAPPPRVTYGHSKKHRPDLKQVIFGSLVSQDGGVPLLGKVLDGNASDSTAAAEFLGRIREIVADPREVCCVTDCKGWCGTVLARCEADGLRLLSRLPRNRTLHNTILEMPQEHPQIFTPTPQVVEPGSILQTKPVDTYTYWGFDAEETFEVTEAAADGAESKRKFTIPVRALRVHSTALERIKRSTWERERMRQQKRAAQVIKGLQQFAYACEADAQRAATRHICQHVFSSLELKAVVIRLDGPYKRGPGRPPTNHSPEPALDAKEHWRINYTSAPISDKSRDEIIRISSTYVLIRIVRDGWDISDQDMIVHYKLQHHVERGFSWMKSTADINPMFLHTPHRIASMGMIYCLGLIINTTIQRTVRKFLNDHGMGLPYHRGKKSANITTRFIFELMPMVQTVVITMPDGNRERRTTGYDGWQQIVAQALGTPNSAFTVVA